MLKALLEPEIHYFYNSKQKGRNAQKGRLAVMKISRNALTVCTFHKGTGSRALHF